MPVETITTRLCQLEEEQRRTAIRRSIEAAAAVQNATLPDNPPPPTPPPTPTTNPDEEWVDVPQAGVDRGFFAVCDCEECNRMRDLAGVPRPTPPPVTTRTSTWSPTESAEVPIDENAPMTPLPKNLRETLTFGVEIECFIPLRKFNAAGWTDGDWGSPANIPGFPGWKLKTDSSLHTARTTAIGREIVSPPLKGLAGLREVEQMLKALNGMDAYVNSSCGGHVHVGAQYFSIAALRRLIGFTSYQQAGIYAATGTPARETTHYCKSSKDHLRKVQHLKTWRELRGAQGDRMLLLNLSNVSADGRKKNTVEFRVWSASLNWTKVSAFIQLSLGMVEWAILTKRGLPWDSKNPRPATDGRLNGELSVNRLLKALGWGTTRNSLRGWLLNFGDELAAGIGKLQLMGRRYDQKKAESAGTKAIKSPFPPVTDDELKPWQEC